MKAHRTHRSLALLIHLPNILYAPLTFSTNDGWMENTLISLNMKGGVKGLSQSFNMLLGVAS